MWLEPKGFSPSLWWDALGDLSKQPIVSSNEYHVPGME